MFFISVSGEPDIGYVMSGRRTGILKYIMYCVLAQVPNGKPKCPKKERQVWAKRTEG
jgi:hypothetical protein